ncbi:MAG: hypothetical protein ACM3OO_01220 [Planctomycetaceae bacterium]
MSAGHGFAGHLPGPPTKAGLGWLELQGSARERAPEQRFTVRPPSLARALARWLWAAVCAGFAATLIWAVVTKAVEEPVWVVLGLLDAAAFIVAASLFALAAMRTRTIGTVVVASAGGLQVRTAHATFTRRLGLRRWENLLWGGTHRLAWDGIERFALQRRVVAVFANGKRRRLAIRGSLPLVHWLNDRLIEHTTGGAWPR